MTGQGSSYSDGLDLEKSTAFIQQPSTGLLLWSSQANWQAGFPNAYTIAAINSMLFE